MVHIHHDLDYLRRIRSPMVGQLARVEGPLPREAVEWYRMLEARDGPIDPGVAFYADDVAHDVHAQLTRGLNPAGRAQLLRNSIEVKCRPGDVVLRVGDGGRSMGFVQRARSRWRMGDALSPCWEKANSSARWLSCWIRPARRTLWPSAMTRKF